MGAYLAAIQEYYLTPLHVFRYNSRMDQAHTTEDTMNKATKRRKALAAKLTTMVNAEGIFRHDPATVGHKVHTAACWTRDEGLELDRRYLDSRAWS